jgi:hypothetical protein
MPRTYEPIATQRLTSSAATIEFTSIPSTYTDLRFVISGSYDSSLNIANLTFNGDTGSNYSDTFITGDGSTVSSGRASSQVRIRTGQFATTQGLCIHDIMNYSNTTTHKTVLISGSLPASNLFRWVGLWRNTAAITSVKLDAFSGLKFVAGTTATLYGIKAA